MVKSQNLFREYIYFRSRMAVYAALGLMVLLLLGIAALLFTGPTNINRFGLLLQILGALALAPDVIGKEKFARWRQAQPAPVPQTGGAPQPTSAEAPVDAAMRDEAFLRFYETHNLTFVLGNTIAAVALVWLLVDSVLAPRPEYFQGELLWRLLFSFLGFAWLNFFMLLNIYRLLGAEISRGMLAWFFAVDLFVGLLGVIFAGLAHILLRWAAGGLNFIFSNGPRRVLLIITLPFFIAGLFFELIATFI
jgi:hypothetical protein